MNSTLLCVSLFLGQPSDDPTALIDRYLERHWKDKKIAPSERCTDHEFLRRASLDLIGRIPTVAEIDGFLRDPPETRRRLLIDRLLAHDDALRHWAYVWTEWLFEGAGDANGREAFHGWLQQHLAKSSSHKELATKLFTAKGSVRDNPAGYFWIAQRGTRLPENARRIGQYDMLPATDQVARVFLGRRILCVQCHDHPDVNEDLSQHHFHGLTAFFRQVEFRRKDTVEEVDDNPLVNTSGLSGYVRPNSIRLYSDPTFLDGKKIPRNFKGSRREAFVQMLTASPAFSKAFVNRMWAHLFGQSLCRGPYADNLTDDTLVHPELLDRLAEGFTRSGHDPKWLLRAICNSQAYDLSSIANRTNVGLEQATAFARMQARHLSNEQLVESVLSAVGPSQDQAWRAAHRTAWLRDLARPRLDAPSECDYVPCRFNDDHFRQRSLWLINSRSLNDALQHKEGMLAAIMRDPKQQPRTALRSLFLGTLARPPTEREVNRLLELAHLKLPKAVGEREVYWRQYYEDVLWAILNSNEFALNH